MAACWPGVVLLLALLPLPAAAQEAADACPPFPAQGNRAPYYPPSELWRLLDYTVNVIIDVDGCGRVVEARVEHPSGVPALDEAALSAARDWIVAPEYRGQPHYRLPFAFNPLPEALPPMLGRRPRDPFFDERSSGRVAPPEAQADGTLPGYIADPYPIGYMQVREAIASIGPLALFRRYGSVANFWLRDEEGLSLFQYEGPLMVRNRLVDDGQRRFVVTSALCGNDLEACREALAKLRAQRGPQQPHPLAAPSP